MNTSTTNSKNYDSETIGSEASFTNDSSRANIKRNHKPIKTNRVINQINDKRIRISDKICNEFQVLEKLIWNSNQFIEKSNKNEVLSEMVLKILL